MNTGSTSKLALRFLLFFPLFFLTPVVDRRPESRPSPMPNAVADPGAADVGVGKVTRPGELAACACGVYSGLASRPSHCVPSSKPTAAADPCTVEVGLNRAARAGVAGRTLSVYTGGAFGPSFLPSPCASRRSWVALDDSSFALGELTFATAACSSQKIYIYIKRRPRPQYRCHCHLAGRCLPPPRARRLRRWG